MKILMTIIISSLTLAGSGSAGNGLGSSSRGSGSAGNGLGKGVGASSGINIIHFYEKLNNDQKQREIVELPKDLKIKVDRDFISPINRWTLKTKQRELLANDFETLKKFDDLKLDSLLMDTSSLESKIKNNGFKLKDF